MLYEWVYPLHRLHGLSFLNLFRYITVRSALAALITLLICVLAGPAMIRWLRRHHFGQVLRKEGPASHGEKKDTPTMGGLLIVGSVLIGVLLCGNFHSMHLWLALGTTLWLAALGFLDDWLHVVKKVPTGLLGRWKLVGQFGVGAIVGIVMLVYPEPGMPVTVTHVPFIKFHYLELGLLFVPFVAFWIAGFSNAVNLTDGLNGLASGLVAIAALALAGMSYLTGHAKFSHYLNLDYLAYTGELTVFCAAVFGAALGFLWHNCDPADVFMGDTGSLALGGALGVVAVLIKREFWLVAVGGVFVAETLSVMIQVASFKLTGKRVFRMSPLHHHWDPALAGAAGVPERRLVLRFYIVGVLLALLSLSTFKLQ